MNTKLHNVSDTLGVAQRQDPPNEDNTRWSGLTASANAPMVMRNMGRVTFRRLIWWVVLGVTTLALTAVVSLPRYHYDEEATASDSDTTCRVCQLSDGLSAAPPFRCAMPVLSVTTRWQPPRAPRLALTCVVGRVVSPRAPPADASVVVHV